MQSGELIVTGKDKALIHLAAFPSKVSCRFKDVQNIVPCNPHHGDFLEYSVAGNASDGFVLIIIWDVSGVREIVWHAYY